MLTAAAAAAAPTTHGIKSSKPCVHALESLKRICLLHQRNIRHARRCQAGVTDNSKDVRALLESSNQLWLEHSYRNHLTDQATGVNVILLGVCFFAPMQQQLVQSALLQLAPDYIAIEQPLDTSANMLSPLHPEWIQALIDNKDVIDDVINNFEQPTQASLIHAEPAAGPLQQLKQQLQQTGHPQAAVGRTIIDPWETFGFYSGMDLYKNPAAVAPVLQLCGFLPGHEVLAAAQHAMHTGATLSCIDAPIKLQEGWVKQLLQNFALDEHQVTAYQPAKDLKANQKMLPEAAAAWDKQLAAMAQQLQQAVQSAQAEQEGSTAAAQGGAGITSQTSMSEQQELLLFQVSKATAAAMLSPAAAQDAIQRLQRLQPLKWAHFALRQRYMAQQLKELCTAAAKAAGRQPGVAVRQQQQQQQHQPSSAFDASASGSANGSSLSEQPANNQSAAASSVKPAAKPVTVLVVVGRQHVHGLLSMWQDPGSSLWRDRMPRSFAASTVEQPEGVSSSVAGAGEANPGSGHSTADS